MGKLTTTKQLQTTQLLTMKFTLFALATVFALTEARQGRMLKAEQHPGRELRSSRRNRNDRGGRDQERDSDEERNDGNHSLTERFASWAAESGGTSRTTESSRLDSQ